jgi:hypothetical protein
LFFRTRSGTSLILPSRLRDEEPSVENEDNINRRRSLQRRAPEEE